jgi:hypothetical protein
MEKNQIKNITIKGAREIFSDGVRSMRALNPNVFLKKNVATNAELLSNKLAFKTLIGNVDSYICQPYSGNFNESNRRTIDESMEIIHDLTHLLFGELFGVHNDIGILTRFPDFEFILADIKDKKFRLPPREYIYAPHIIKAYHEFYPNIYTKYLEESKIGSQRLNTPSYILDYQQLFERDLRNCNNLGNKRVEKVALESVRWNLFYLLYREIIIPKGGYTDEYIEAIKNNTPIPFLSEVTILRIQEIQKACYNPSDEEFMKFYKEKFAQKDSIMDVLIARNIEVMSEVVNLYNAMIASGEIEGTLPENYHKQR